MKNLCISSLLLSLCLPFSSCEADLAVQAGQAEPMLPQFNFQVRQLESAILKIDSTLVVDTLSGLDSVYVVDTSLVMDTIKLELYIRQLDFTAEEEKYRVVVSLPANFDGQLYYQGSFFRSEDWIEIRYEDLLQHTTVLSIIQQKGEGGLYQLTLVCSDREDQAKSVSLPIRIP